MNNDLYIWQHSPGQFFNRYKPLLIKVIRKNFFYGHLDKDALRKVEYYLMQEMERRDIIGKISGYKGRSTFLSFYIKILKDVVTNFSQEEDIGLLENNTNKLILKYRQLVCQEVACFVSSGSINEDIADDFIQEILTGLFEKINNIRKSYKPEKLFRNYIWTIIKNGCLKLLKLKLKKYHKEELNEGNNYSMVFPDIENSLMLKNTYEQFYLLLKSYEQLQAKLELCLKISHSLPIKISELKNLFPDNEQAPPVEILEEVSICLSKMNINNKPGNLIKRFGIIRPLLNNAVQSNTDEKSYWRWTNMHIEKLIKSMNENHALKLNRETFRILIEKYYSQSNTEPSSNL